MKKFLTVSILATLFLTVIGMKCTQGENMWKLDKNIGKFEKDGISHNNYYIGDTLLLLKDGKILLRNNQNLEMYEPIKKKFEVINSPKIKFSKNVLLQDGKVLFLPFNNTERAEIYDPSTDKFVSTGKMNYSRISPAVVLLQNGKILIVGGYNEKRGKLDEWVKKTELYNPETGKFELTGFLNNPERRHIGAILLKNGKVLIFGGNTNTTELYDSKTGKFSYGGDLNIKRPNGMDTVMLKDGRVIFYGESDWLNRPETWGTRLEIYNPDINKFVLMPEMKIKRRGFSATLLNNGKVLFAGSDKAIFGFGGDSSELIERVEIYDPNKNEFSLDAKMIYPRTGPTSILLNNGEVLIVGGSVPYSSPLKQAELYCLEK